MMREIKRVSTKGGFRADIGIYVRSKWESNIARYLNWLKKQGEILKWEYEPEEFKFPVKKGSIYYKPDFKITEKSGKVVYWEVKGFMDQKSKTKLKRMALYYPDVKIVIIDKVQYQSIKKFAKLFKGWED